MKREREHLQRATDKSRDPETKERNKEKMDEMKFREEVTESAREVEKTEIGKLET